MVVLDDTCEKCNRVCNSIYFQRNFKNWTSDNNEIDNFIKDTQSSAHNDVRGVLEWIPYDRFYGVKYISKDEFGEVYRANWVDGYISNFQSWDGVNQNWERNNFNMFVNLRILNTPNDLTFELVLREFLRM
jgi:hypothetical protein